MKTPPDPELAHLLREIRQLAGKKQRYIATRAQCTVPNVSQAENGKQHPSRELISAYLHLTEMSNDMRRRNLLLAAAAGIGAVALPDTALAQAADQALHPDVDTWEATLHQLAQDNMQHGTTVMRTRVGTALKRLWATPHGGVLNRPQAKLLMMYARTEPDSARATGWYRRATEAADQADDPTTTAWVYGRAALASSGDNGSMATATLTTDFAQRAIATGPTGESIAAIGVYMGYIALARMAANQDDWEGTLHYCDQAQRAYEQVDPDDDGNEFTYSGWRHALTLCYPLSRIGHAEAERWQQEAYALGATGRFTTHLQLQQAIRLHRDGDPEGPQLARTTMAAAQGDNTTLILRTMAAQAGASEYAVNM